MKTEGQIKQKFKQASFRHMKNRIEAAQTPSASNCLYNKVLEASQAKMTVGVCGCPTASLRICDDVLGTPAKTCPFFAPVHTVAKVKSEFSSFIESASIAEIAMEYPDLAALLWVLDKSIVSEVAEELVEASSTSDPIAPKVTATAPVEVTPEIEVLPKRTVTELLPPVAEVVFEHSYTTPEGPVFVLSTTYFQGLDLGSIPLIEES